MQTFNDTTCPKFVWQGAAFVTFNLKQGRITFNGSAAKMMELRGNDQVEFYHNDEDNSWYVAKVDNRGFRLNSTNYSRSLIFTRKELIISIYNANFYEGQTVRCNILRQRKVNGKMLFKIDLSGLKNK